MFSAKLRGHAIYTDDGETWRYTDTGERTVETNRERPCGHCGLYSGKDGHDPCIGELQGVMNACCGHGSSDEAYVQWWSGAEIRGDAACEYIQENSRTDG